MVMIEELLFRPAPLFADRREAGVTLAAELQTEAGPELVVEGLARGGVEVAAEVARILEAPLDVVAVRKVGHPFQPEYGLGAVTPGDGVYLRGSDGLTEEELEAAVERARAKAARLDEVLHAENAPLELAGKSVVVVDDGLATGGTMIAALRWAKARGAARVVAAVPIAAQDSLERVRAEADLVVCPHALVLFPAVGFFYRSFEQVGDAEVVRLLRERRAEVPAAQSSSRAAGTSR